MQPSGRTSTQDACPGALAVHPADDGNLARVRVPGGALRAGQLRALAHAATRVGDGHLELTSRGNIQLRGLAPGAEVELTQLLHGAGLLPSESHERVRNIVASVLSGRDDLGWLDIRPLVAELDTGLCAEPGLAGLSGRFLFTIDDGRDDVSSLRGDVGLLAAGPDTFALLLAGTDSGLRTRPGTAVAVALAAARAFLDWRDERRSTVWRLAELDPPARRSCVAAVEASAAGHHVWRGDPSIPSQRPSHRPSVGAIQQRDDRTAICVAVPLGRLAAPQADALCRAADDGGGEVRITPWRTALVPDLDSGPATRWVDALAATGLAVESSSALANVSACAGRPGCGRALADVRADALALHAAPSTGATLAVHWSGCERGCGSPADRHVRVRAVAGGYQVGVDGVGVDGEVFAQVPHGDTGLERLTRAVEAARRSNP